MCEECDSAGNTEGPEEAKLEIELNVKCTVYERSDMLNKLSKKFVIIPRSEYNKMKTTAKPSVVLPVKRGRGRPRKDGTPAGSPRDSSKTTAKRGRGRPRKEGTSVDSPRETLTTPVPTQGDVENALLQVGSVGSGHVCSMTGLTVTVGEALKGEYAPQYRHTMKLEEDKFNDQHVLGDELAGEYPKDANIVHSKWVLTRKTEGFKARLVALGNQMETPLEEYLNSAPTARACTKVFLLTMAQRYNHDVRQIDIKSAFLHVKIPDDVKLYVKLPKEHTLAGRVFRLLKAMYGIREAPDCG